MQELTGDKVPNIRLREGANPVTVSGMAYGGSGISIAFPDRESQEKGWVADCPGLVVRCFGDWYEMINGGCNC